MNAEGQPSSGPVELTLEVVRSQDAGTRLDAVVYRDAQRAFVPQMTAAELRSTCWTCCGSGEWRAGWYTRPTRTWAG